jgi:hypothetical protein
MAAFWDVIPCSLVDSKLQGFISQKTTILKIKKVYLTIKQRGKGFKNI